MDACAGPDRRLRKPSYVAPPGATDCHAHIFGPQAKYPFAATRNYTPEDCTIEDYRALIAALGLDRGILVQGGAHGTDNRVTLDALATDPERLRGVAVISAGLPLTERETMRQGGIRGARLSSIVGGSFGQLEQIAYEAQEVDWHLLLHFHRSPEMIDLEPLLKRIPNDFVLDHLGRILAKESVTSESYQCLLRLLDTDRCWVKLASLYRMSQQPYPFRDMLPMIHDVVARRPDRIIWGSNWPHPIWPGVMPNDADMVDHIPLWIPDADVQQQILVRNPEVLYGFPAWAGS